MYEHKNALNDIVTGTKQKPNIVPLFTKMLKKIFFCIVCMKFKQYLSIAEIYFLISKALLSHPSRFILAGPSGIMWGPSGAMRGPFWDHVRPCGDHQGPCGDYVGTMWGPYGTILDHEETTRDHMGTM